MLAAPIGIDRAVEADVGAVVAGDDLAGLLDLQLVFSCRARRPRGPAVVEAWRVKASKRPVAFDLAPRPRMTTGLFMMRKANPAFDLVQWTVKTAFSVDRRLRRVPLVKSSASGRLDANRGRWDVRFVDKWRPRETSLSKKISERTPCTTSTSRRG